MKAITPAETYYGNIPEIYINDINRLLKKYAVKYGETITLYISDILDNWSFTNRELFTNRDIFNGYIEDIMFLYETNGWEVILYRKSNDMSVLSWDDRITFKAKLNK